MKKKLTEAIKAKFVGIDDSTASRLADRAFRKGEPITTDDEVAAAVEAITLSDVLKSVSDFSSDEATRKYETKYGLKDGVPVQKEEPSKPEEKEVKKEVKKEAEGDPMEALKSSFADMLKSFDKKLDSLGSEISAIKTGKLTENRKAKIDAIIAPLRESQKKAYARIPVDKMSDDDFEGLLNEIQVEVNDIASENKADGSIVSAPLGGKHIPPADGKEASKEEMDALVGKFNFS